MSSNPRSSTALLTKASAEIGATLPKPVRDAIDRAGITIAAAAETTTIPPLAELLVAALEAGRVPAEDPAVQAAVTAQKVNTQAHFQSIEAVIYRRVGEACKAHADDVVAALAKPFDRAAVALVAAHERIGDVALEDSTTILRRGADIAQVWADAKTAVQTIGYVLDAWSALVDLSGGSRPDRRFQALRLADLDLVDLRTLRDAGPWDLVRAGRTLSLPTPAEAQQRRNKVVAPIGQREMVPGINKATGRPELVGSGYTVGGL